MVQFNAQFSLDESFLLFMEAAPDAIVIVDDEGVMVSVNSLTENLFVYTKVELLGNKVELLIPDQFHSIHIKHRVEYTQNPKKRMMGEGQELSGLRKDKTQFPVEISLSPLAYKGKTFVISIIRDITERNRVEEQIKASLQEKEALLKEIHHRVKNNLQVISSLLRLQSSYVQDEVAKALFVEGQNRIKSMALVHEKLYQNNDLSRINFLEYAQGLCLLLLRTYGLKTDKVKLHFSGAASLLNIDTAIPCGLIINELFSNCLKHGFPEDRSGNIFFDIQSEGENITMTIADDGIGFPLGFSIEKVESLGLKLVKTLSKQIGGQCRFVSDHGVRFTLTFKNVGGKHE